MKKPRDNDLGPYSAYCEDADEWDRKRVVLMSDAAFYGNKRDIKRIRLMARWLNQAAKWLEAKNGKEKATP